MRRTRLVVLLVALAVVAALVLGAASPERDPATGTRGQEARSSGHLSVAPTMAAARAAHTATTLPDGRVLVAGGFTDGAGAVQAAEVFGPPPKAFSGLPRMITPRQSHTATLLPNGKVLLAGGYAAGTEPTRAAELFDPASNRFVPTGPLVSARAGAVAVLLSNGKVLVAGGIGPGWSFLASAELYDPTTGRFSATGSMSVARESHVAVGLRNGRVLIVGGHRGRRPAITLYTSAEVYDPATGKFRAVGSMHVRRHKHDAVRLRDGRVLVTGGTDERDGRGIYDSTELFDPARNAFTPGPRMLRPRYKHQGSSLLLPGGKVLIAGGATQAETYDPVANRFAIVDGNARLAGQFSAVASLRDGRVLVTGGYGDRGGARASAWVYRP